MTVFLCGEEFEDILSGVYDAWMSRLGHDNVRLESKKSWQAELFCEYKQVEVSGEKAEKVAKAVRERISEEAYSLIYEAALSMREDRADKIYRFLIYGFHYKAKIVDMLQIPAVFHIFEMHRHLANEAHLLKGFVRFSQMEEGILLSTIGPKNDVLVLLARHFGDRLSGENWIIYDEKRSKAAIHQSGKGWMIVRTENDQWKERLKPQYERDKYEDLWKSFFHSIAVRERKNPVCQRNFLPLRYRGYMTEFQSDESV
ncbi:TIGR03915 family putative DNA repair protein [Lachnospiraceae bacterium 62-35]